MTDLITAAQLKTIAGPGSRSDMIAAIVRGWPNAVAKAKLTTRLRAAHFIAQIMTETGGLQILEESGAYRAARIMQIFGVGHHSARITEAEAQRIAALPVAQRGPVLFNRVYGTGNPSKMREFKNTGPNDGWLYRGGGMMQATGKSNYAVLEAKTGLPLVAHPELLHQPDSAFTAAYLEWAQDGRCNAAADRDDTPAVRRIINGGSNGLAECRNYVARAKQVLAGYGADAPQTFISAPEQDPAPDPSPVAPPPPPDVDQLGRPDASVVGDPLLFSVQRRLKAMNYAPGVLSGVWGGMTAGAISGFLNDRGSQVAAPTSLDMFNSVVADIGNEMQRAEAEGFKRPVTPERAQADPKTVAAVAPEVLPARRNFLAAAWASVVTFCTAVWNWLQDKVSAAWDFYTGHKDDLGDTSGWWPTVREHLAQVPTSFWILAAAGGLAWIAFDARSSVKKITASVQTGARQ